MKDGETCECDSGIWFGQRRMTKPFSKVSVEEEGDYSRVTDRKGSCSVKHGGQEGHAASWWKLRSEIQEIGWN